jgi:hypothetical protein
MIFLKVNRSKLFLVIFAAFLASCAPKPAALLLTDKNRVLTEISAVNTLQCSYKGRVTVRYDDGSNDLRFKALLNKKCADEFVIKILGAFSGVVYDISYSHGDVKAYEKGEDRSGLVKEFMINRGLDKLVLSLRFPYLFPDESYVFSTDNGFYVFSRPEITVKVMDDFLIDSITVGEIDYKYGYKEGRINSVTMTQNGSVLEIRLLR